MRTFVSDVVQGDVVDLVCGIEVDVPPAVLERLVEEAGHGAAAESQIRERDAVHGLGGVVAMNRRDLVGLFAVSTLPARTRT